MPCWRRRSVGALDDFLGTAVAGLASVATVVGLFWPCPGLGCTMVPPIGRAIGLGVFFLLAAAAFAPFLMLRIPSRMDGGSIVTPACPIGRPPRSPTRSPLRPKICFPSRCGRPCGARVARPRRSRPGPRCHGWRDPFAVRALAVLVVATFFAAGGERMKRVAAAFDWQGVMVPANFRIDAWVSPPTYTGRPPVILQGLRPGEPVNRRHSRCRQKRPRHPRDWNPPRRDRERRARRAARRRAERQCQGDRGTPLRDQRSRGSDRAVRAASDVTWQFTAIPDKPPTNGSPRTPRGRRAARCNFPTSQDDYGVVGAQAKFKLQNNEAPTVTLRARSTMRLIFRWCCRRRARRTAPDRAPRI